MKWYDSLIKKIENYGNNVFLYDLDNLLDDKNFLKDLSLKFDVYKYEHDSDYYRFKNKSEPKLIYSNKSIRRQVFKNTLDIRINDVFPDLELKILKNTDVRYFQKIYDYCIEFQNRNFIISKENTKRILFQSIWNVDLGSLYDFTTNLRIALEYIVDKKELDSSIINEISEKLGVNLIECKNDEIKFHSWIESLILNYISENQFNHKYDLSDNLIQYYLSKINLKSKKISDLISDSLLENYSWLIKFKLNNQSTNLIEKRIKSEIVEMNMFFDKIYEDNIIDLNDLDDIFNVSNKFFNIIYEIQSNSLSFSDFDILDYYKRFNQLFKSILEENIYLQLFNYPYYNKPFTVDRILDFINYKYKDDKTALIVLDGMSYDEWFILKKYLDSFKIKELESFSILPSITSFSRTAIFTGKTPNSFLDEKYKPSHNAEEKGFRDYFNKRKIEDNEILFGKIDLNNNFIKTKNENIEFKYLKGYKSIGLICNLFDDESHSMNIYGDFKSNLYKNIDSAIQSSKLVDLLEYLNSEDYKIILTSDHGNIYGEPNGIKSNKMLGIDTRSNRCLIFDNELFADKLVEEYPNECFKWNYNLLSKDLFLIFANQGCFGNKTSISHGSFMPEECIVPVVILE